MAKKSTFRGHLVFSLKLAIVIGAISYLVFSGKLNLNSLIIRWESLHFVIAGVLVFSIGFFFSFIRYHLLLRAIAVNSSLRQTVQLCFIGSFFNSFMFGLGGDLVKVGYIVRESGNWPGAISSIMVDRMLGLIGLFSLGSLAIIAGFHEFVHNKGLFSLISVTTCFMGITCVCFLLSIVAISRGRRHALWIWIIVFLSSVAACWFMARGWDIASIIATASPTGHHIRSLAYTSAIVGLTLVNLLGIGCIAILPSCLPGRTFERFMQKSVPLGGKIMRMIQSLLTYSSHLSTLGWGYILSLVSWFFLILSIFFFARSLPLLHQPTLDQIFFTSPIPFIAGMVPLPGSGIGVVESVFEHVLHLCATSDGHPISGGSAIFLTWRLWMTVISLIGLPLYLNRKAQIDTSLARLEAEHR